MTKARLLITFAALLIGAASGATAQQHRWRDRLLIVFSPDAASSKLADQRRSAASARAAFAERDLILIEVVGETVRGSSDTAQALRKRYRVAPEAFRVLLVGKDGGVKLASPDPLAPQRLFETIDAMPMRRDEMHGG